MRHRATRTARNITSRTPYMHNGAFDTLPQVIAFYNKGGGKDPRRDPLVQPVNLTEAEAADLLAFLESLTGDLPKIEAPDLPD